MSKRYSLILASGLIACSFMACGKAQTKSPAKKADASASAGANASGLKIAAKDIDPACAQAEKEALQPAAAVLDQAEKTALAILNEGMLPLNDGRADSATATHQKIAARFEKNLDRMRDKMRDTSDSIIGYNENEKKNVADRDKNLEKQLNEQTQQLSKAARSALKDFCKSEGLSMGKAEIQAQDILKSGWSLSKTSCISKNQKARISVSVRYEILRNPTYVKGTHVILETAQALTSGATGLKAGQEEISVVVPVRSTYQISNHAETADVTQTRIQGESLNRGDFTSYELEIKNRDSITVMRKDTTSAVQGLASVLASAQPACNANKTLDLNSD